MIEEEVNNNTHTPEPTSGVDDSNNNTNTPVSIRYCTTDDVTSLFDVNISDSLEKENLINIAIENATARIHSKLRANKIPLPDQNNISSTIKTVAIYFAICDLYGSLYSGSDYEEQKNFWCIYGSELLDDYIQAYENTCAEDLDQYSTSGHSNSLTYKERKKTWIRD